MEIIKHVEKRIVQALKIIIVFVSVVCMGGGINYLYENYKKEQVFKSIRVEDCKNPAKALQRDRELMADLLKEGLISKEAAEKSIKISKRQYKEKC